MASKSIIDIVIKNSNLELNPGSLQSRQARYQLKFCDQCMGVSLYDTWSNSKECVKTVITRREWSVDT
jgi:hypothetical protein